MFRSFNLRSQLTMAFLACGLIPLAVISSISYFRAASGFASVNQFASEQFQQNATDLLVAQRELKKKQLLDYFDNINSQIRTFSENEMIVNAMREMGLAAQQLTVENEWTDEEIGQMRSNLRQYYANAFAKEYARKNDNKTPNAEALLAQLDDMSVALQHEYIAENKNPLGEKHRFDAC